MVYLICGAIDDDFSFVGGSGSNIVKIGYFDGTANEVLGHRL